MDTPQPASSIIIAVGSYFVSTQEPVLGTEPQAAAHSLQCRERRRMEKGREGGEKGRKSPQAVLGTKVMSLDHRWQQVDTEGQLWWPGPRPEQVGLSMDCQCNQRQGRGWQDASWGPCSTSATPDLCPWGHAHQADMSQATSPTRTSP